MSIAFFSGLDVLKYIHGSLPPLLYIKSDLYQSEIEILVTMCFYCPKHGSPILATSYNWSFNPYQVSSPMNDSFTGAVSSATGVAMNRCAALQLLWRICDQIHPRSITDPPAWAATIHTPSHSRGRADKLYNVACRALALTHSLEGIPRTRITPSAGQHCGTWATTFWICSEEIRQGQTYLLSLFTDLDVPTSPGQQQEPESVQRCLSIPVSQIDSSKSRSLYRHLFLSLSIWTYYSNNSYNLKSFSKELKQGSCSPALCELLVWRQGNVPSSG